MTRPELFAPESEEKRLAVAFKQGDDGAYESIYLRYAPRVRSICRKMLTNEHDADEAVQEAFLRVYQGLGRFNGRYQLGAWVARIATNVCLDHLRSRTRRPCDPADPENLTDYLEEVPGPEVAAIKRFEGRRVTKVLKTLPPMHRAAIVLRDVEGLSYEEVAECLGITESQVKALLHRARKGFRRKWSPAVASFLFPWRLIPKLRQAEHATRDAVPNASLGAQFLVQCSGTLQQCGQFVTERVTSMVAATAMGAAAVTGAATGAVEFTPVPPVVSERLAESGLVAEKKESTQQVEERVAVSDSEGTVAPESPEPTPWPSPSPSGPAGSPSPSGQAGGSGASLTPATPPSSSPSAKPSPTQVSEPQHFSFIGTVGGPLPSACSSCYFGTDVISESGRSDSSGLLSYTQKLEGTVYNDGTRAYGVELSHRSSSMSSQAISFLLWTGEGAYSYAGEGSLVRNSRTSWGRYEYLFSGSFTRSGGPRADEYTPSKGGYELSITYSESQKRILSTRLSLSPSE